MEFLKSLFLKKPSDADQSTGDDDLQTAFAALLVEAARADEHYDDKERALITTLIGRQFDLSPEAAAGVRTRGENAQAAAIDLHQFTRSVKQLGAEEKRSFMEGLWRIVLSDGVRDPWEESLVRRVASLIHVTDQESARARQAVSGD
ncbi:MAG: TerB family tellurite resistance protein [Pseudomonadota bacterium]